MNKETMINILNQHGVDALYDAYLDGYDKGWKDSYAYRIKEEH